MSIVREYIRSILAEDLRGFLNRTWDLGYYAGSGDAASLDKPENKESKEKARLVKTIWQEEADQNFFASLTKVHWLQDTGTYNTVRTNEMLNNIISLQQTGAEIPTTGYTPGTVQNLAWGQWGVVVGGDKCMATFAANTMEAVVSGYVSISALERSYIVRGTNPMPRRALQFTPRGSTNIRDESSEEEKAAAIERLIDNPVYLLDAESWREPTRRNTNEIIVKHWDILGIVVANDSQVTSLFDSARGVTKGVYNPNTRSYARANAREIPDLKVGAMNLIQTILDSGYNVFVAPDTDNAIDFRGMAAAAGIKSDSDLSRSERFQSPAPPKISPERMQLLRQQRQQQQQDSQASGVQTRPLQTPEPQPPKVEPVPSSMSWLFNPVDK
jgi:hypothetical protein